MNIGEKVRRLRLAHSLTQEELAGRSDLTKGFISQLERDQASPSIATLKGILDVFSVSLADFFREPERREKVVFGVDDRKDLYDDHADIHLLIPSAHGNNFDVALVTLAPGQEVVDDGHEGEEFGFVFRGALDLLFEDGSRHRARKNECFFFPAHQRHEIRNSSGRPAQFLWVVSPPTFF
ncbi:MAG: cupin domain-containing protein [Deltaproteobacteria bacterium]|nr:cupin domain-containing protein [Candidatus Anaeroferrophillacea bacterium]